MSACRDVLTVTGNAASWETMGADALTAALERAAAVTTRARRAGKCDHGWWQDARDGNPAKCLHCGKEFASESALLAEREAVRGEYR